MGRAASPAGSQAVTVAELDVVADELYELRPGEFTAARDARAAQARQAGDRQLAAAIKALRRPTTSAWLANTLVRRRREEMARLLQLGAEMRVAQRRLAAEELRLLSAERHEVIVQLGRAARLLANELGQAVSAQADRELERTLEAVAAETAASEAVRSGRLTAALSYAGLGAEEGAAPVIAPAADASPGRHTRERAAGDVTGQSEEPGRRARVVERQQALREAEAIAASARRERGLKQRLVEDARRRHEQLLQQIGALEDQLSTLRGEEKQAARKIGDRERELEVVQGAVGLAEQRLGEVESDVSNVGDRG